MITIALGLFFGVMLIRASEGIGFLIVLAFSIWLIASIIEAVVASIVFVGSIVLAVGAAILGTYVAGMIAWLLVGAIVKLTGRRGARVVQTAVRWPTVAWSRLVVPCLTKSVQQTADVITRVWEW